jgi:hypothetical protein
MLFIDLVVWLRHRQIFTRQRARVKRGFFKNPIRATAAKEAGQGMSTEETAVRPDQNGYEFAKITFGSKLAAGFLLSAAGCDENRSHPRSQRELAKSSPNVAEYGPESEKPDHPAPPTRDRIALSSVGSHNFLEPASRRSCDDYQPRSCFDLTGFCQIANNSCREQIGKSLIINDGTTSGIYHNAAKTSAACASGFTCSQMFLIRPSGPMRNVTRCVPRYFRPMNFLSPQTP